jgi:ribosomal protein S4E
MKRLNAPSHWMLDKLGGIFVSMLGSYDTFM